MPAVVPTNEHLVAMDPQVLRRREKMPTTLEVVSKAHAQRTNDGPTAEPAYAFRFGEHELCAATWELRRGGERVALGGQAVGMLLYLIRFRHRIVSRQELMDAMWKDTQVQDGSISQLIWQIRRSVQDSQREQRVVRTLRGRGYRFVAAVEQAVCAGEDYDVGRAEQRASRHDGSRGQASRIGGMAQ